MKKKYKANNRFTSIITLLAILVCVFTLYNLLNPNKGVKNPGDILVLINRENHISSTYVPDDLTIPKVEFTFKEDLPKKKMRKEAAAALEKLFDAAKKEGIQLYGVSGYRSFETQKQLFEQRVKAVGKEAAMKYVARAGESEHQTGFAMDITNSKGAKNQLTEDFGQTKEGKWVKKNASKYGFIVRYPLGKEDITGYNYEPWHIRYVGVEASEAIASKGYVLEEFLAEASAGKVAKK